jgi:type 1 fimbria pilin
VHESGQEATVFSLTGLAPFFLSLIGCGAERSRYEALTHRFTSSPAD